MQDEQNIVHRAQQGDQEAFAQLYESHFDDIYRYVTLRIGNRMEAEDITQEVFLKAVRSIQSFKWKGIPFSAWLFRIARNEVIDSLRKKPSWATAHQRITKMGALAPRIETCYPQIGCIGRYLFGGIAPRKKLTTVACMHHELLLLFQEARGTNYKQQGCHYPIKKEETWKQFSKGAVESTSTSPSLLLAYW